LRHEKIHMDLAGYAAINAAFGAIAVLVSIYLLQALFSKKTGPLRERLPFFDFLKGVCIVFVIMMHIKDIAPVAPELVAPLWLAVPAFIFVSGYLTMRRNPESVGGDYFWKILWRIGLVYMIFTVFWMFLLNVPLGNLPAYLLLGRANGGSLYFIPVLLSLYVIFPLLLRLQQKAGWVPFLLLVLCFSTIFEYADVQYNSAQWDANPASLAFFGRLLFVFAAGMFMSRIEADDLKGWLPMILGLVGSIAAIDAVVDPSLHFLAYLFGPPVFTYFLMSLYQNITPRLKALTGMFEELGRNSLVIYMAHPSLLYIFPAFVVPALGLSAFMQTPFAFYALVIVATCLSYGISLIFMKAYRAALAGARIWPTPPD